MPALNSASISWIEYDPYSRTLQVTFRSGRMYTLRGVPEYHYLALLNASSPGAYFNENLRGRY